MSVSGQYLPAAGDAIQLPVDDLAVRLLRLIHEAQQGHLLNGHNVKLSGSWAEHEGFQAHRAQFLEAMAEAWNWLESQGLVAQRPDDSSTWAFITRKGRRVLASERGLDLLMAEERISLKLHPLIERSVRRQFLLGEYEMAAFAAMREVEIRVRQLSGASESDIGVNLIKHAFKKDGPLADGSLDPGEREATMALYWGAIGVFKNPSSHRQVEFADPTVASEVIFVADLLLRMLDSTEQRLSTTS